MTTSQCSSRKARTDAEAFSRQPYSESMLQILLNSLAECSDGVKASIYISASLSRYKVLDPWYAGASRWAAWITRSI